MSEADEQSKKDRILALCEGGTTDIAEIVKRVSARPSYVAQVLQQAGILSERVQPEQIVYARFFRNVLKFESVEAARESVAKLDRLFNYFERLGDRAGQHQAMTLALTGMNRARWSGKHAESAVFSTWLSAHSAACVSGAKNITREQLVNLINQLATSQQSWNDCVADDDRGPSNYAFCLFVYDDGSGFIGDGHKSFVNEQRHFDNAEQAADVLIEMHDALEAPE